MNTTLHTIQDGLGPVFIPGGESHSVTLDAHTDKHSL